VLDDISDDEDEDKKKKSGCLPHRPRSATFDSPSRPRHDSEPTHHSRLAEKLLSFFRPQGSQTGSGRQSPTSRGGQAPRRRFMRVVKDENAPPPECVGDNPNVICRYSQEYLSKHYAQLERLRDSSRPTLPYTTSGHTILKKSSTDPTSDRRVPSATMKHTTFNDVVTVVDSEEGEVREEPLRSTADDDEDDLDEGSPYETGFFLSPTCSESGPADEVDGSMPDSAIQKDELVDEVISDEVSSVGLMSVFSTASSPQTDKSTQRNFEELKTSSVYLPITKHVKLVDLMAQIRADDDGERS